MISILRKLLFVSNTCNTTISLLWKLVYFFFTLIKEINIILRLNLWKKNALGIEKVMHSVCFWNIRPLLFVFVTIKKNPSVFARNEDFFRFCTWDTPVFNFKGNNSVFSTSLFVIHEKSSQHSRRGTSDKYM